MSRFLALVLSTAITKCIWAERRRMDDKEGYADQWENGQGVHGDESAVVLGEKYIDAEGNTMYYDATAQNAGLQSIPVERHFTVHGGKDVKVIPVEPHYTNFETEPVQANMRHYTYDALIGEGVKTIPKKSSYDTSLDDSTSSDESSLESEEVQAPDMTKIEADNQYKILGSDETEDTPRAMSKPRTDMDSRTEHQFRQNDIDPEMVNLEKFD